MHGLTGIIRDLLQRIIDNIDAGNSNLSEEDALHAIDLLRQYTDKELPLSKYQAARFLGISRASFDNLIKEGVLPKGKKSAGFKELIWHEKDLIPFKDKIRHK